MIDNGQVSKFVLRLMVSASATDAPPASRPFRTWRAGGAPSSPAQCSRTVVAPVLAVCEATIV